MTGSPILPVPSTNRAAVLHWADGRIWNVIVGDVWRFRVDGHNHCFTPSGAVDPHGIAIWVECPPDLTRKHPVS